MFDPINLDDITTEPSELLELANVLSRLGCYADYKAQAMRLRLAGDIEAALSFERCCDHQYKLLPDWAKW